jgi:tRNA pseudouridine55 synthase
VPVTGLFLINKPKGITSHDVVDYLRKVTGHAGTLDPMASGLMIVAIGREFTKQILKFSGLGKEYLADVTLGKNSTTHDAEGELTAVSDRELGIEEIKLVLENFIGWQEQTPPIFSAKKIKGKKAYDLAREGKKVELKSVVIEIKSINLINYQYPEIEFGVEVSAGTYIRSLAYDIGVKLKTGAYLSKLIRIKVGSYSLNRAIDLKDIKSPNDLEGVRIN